MWFLLSKYVTDLLSFYSYVDVTCSFMIVFFFQAEDGIRDLVRSRGLGDVYKRQEQMNKNV